MGQRSNGANRIGYLGAGITLLLGIAQCTPEFQAEYRDPHHVELIDDRWSQADIDQIGHLIRELNRKVSESPEKFGKNPRVIFKDMENRTDEHIDTAVIRNKIIDELTEADAFTFIDAAARAAIAAESKYQNDSGEVSQETAVHRGKQLGAEFFLRGTISSTMAQRDGRKIINYQVNLKLTHLESGAIVWSKQHYTSKDIKRRGYGL